MCAGRLESKHPLGVSSFDVLNLTGTHPFVTLVCKNTNQRHFRALRRLNYNYKFAVVCVTFVWGFPVSFSSKPFLFLEIGDIFTFGNLTRIVWVENNRDIEVQQSGRLEIDS